MHPILFEIGPIPIGSYGLCVLLGLLACCLLAPRYARRAGIDPVVGRELLLLVFMAGWVGCRLLNIVLRFDEMLDNPRIVLWLIQQAGVWYGALIGGGLTLVLLARRWKLNVWAVLDMAAIPALLGGGIGRIGCLLSGCCHGKTSDLPWAITYTNPLAHRLHPELPFDALHPAVLYELVAVLLIALVLDRFGAVQREQGQITLLWVILYGIARMVVELFRGDQIRGTLFGPLSTSQSISLVLVLGAASWMYLRSRRVAG